MSQTAASPEAAARRNALVERLFLATVGTWDVLAVYIGDRLGLYRILAERGAMTPGELAGVAGLSERYAREWLEQQASSAILELDDASAGSATRRYTLPRARRGARRRHEPELHRADRPARGGLRKAAGRGARRLTQR